MPRMIILGIDPGSRKTGFGLVHKSGNHYRHIENGTLYLEKLPNYTDRLVYLYNEIQALVSAFKPEVFSIENIFFHKNPKSVQKLGEVRGVAMVSAARLGLPVFEYAPLEVKKAVTGYGNAKKEQVQFMMCKLLNLKDVPEENACDALALALCHAHSYNQLSTLKSNTRMQNSSSAQELLRKASFYR